MASRIRVVDSSVGTKLLIGATGLFLVLYLLIHIAGNLMVFGGADVFNTYAGALSGNPLILVIEAVLLVVFLVHVFKTIRMVVVNRAARPVEYQMKRSAGGPSRKTVASTTMILSGLWLLAFVVIHVRTFKFGAHYQTPAGLTDLYRVEMETFRSPLTVAFYLVSMLVVGSHVFHGASSAFQSLGLTHPRWTPRVLVIGRLLATGIAGGFIVIALWAHLFGGAR